MWVNDMSRYDVGICDMSGTLKPKYRRVASGSGRSYHKKWFHKFGVIEKDKKVLCVNCNETVVSRSYNVKHHFGTNHKNLSLLSEEQKISVSIGN